MTARDQLRSQGPRARPDAHKGLQYAALVAVLLLAQVAEAVPQWTSANHYCALLTVNGRGVTRHNSPASVDIDVPQILASLGAQGTFDENTVEVIAYDASGVPKVFDSSRSGYERYLLPYRTQKYYGINRVTLSFVMPDQTYTQYAAYFDTVESGLGKPTRYAGLVGDGDFFREVYERRELHPSHFDDYCDFDGDGDLDLFRAGVEPYIYCFENLGGNRFVERGQMTSNGSVFKLPCSPDNRSWMAVEFDDWDGDGDQDLFVSFSDGPENGHVVRYRNEKVETGVLKFTSFGRLLTQSGKALGDGWFAVINVVDWDGDGKKDVLSTRDGVLAFHRNVGPAGNIAGIQLADGVYVLANGHPICETAMRVDCADMDSDGDLDLFVASQGGPVHYFENAGTRTDPVLRSGRAIAETRGGHTGIKAADFDGDGLPDFTYGRLWENGGYCEIPRVYARLYRNAGSRYETRDAFSGCPYTEQFQICDAVRQNSVRTVDWNNDGLLDLIAPRGDGFVWWFRNTTNRLFPVFAPGEPLMSQGEPVQVTSDQGGYARGDICDWNNDGKKDLILADGGGLLWLYLNQGTDAAPVLGPKTAVYAAGVPIDIDWRSSVLVCDWDNDGKKDVIMADQSGYYFYENTNTDASPVLAASKTISFGGQYPTYVRPNLGSYVDWDGDGKKDLIGAHFENSIRYYRNTGSGGVNVEPTFAANANGVTIVQPSTVQLVSGADAKDWNLDGDVDILTGQGHAGSGLRFYERDYINDYLTSLYPISTLGSSERGRTVVECKGLANGASLTVPRALVSAIYDGFFYVQAEDRTNGIRVELANHGRSVGERVDVRGTLGTAAAGERYIAASSITVNP